MNKEKLFREDAEYRTYRILHFAQKHGWKIVNTLAFLLFENKEGATLRIDYSKPYNSPRIETTLNHPKWGNTVMIRCGEFTQKNIESIFKNPRSHMPRKVKSTLVSHKQHPGERPV